jgi:hypothetical protein
MRDPVTAQRVAHDRLRLIAERDRLRAVLRQCLDDYDSNMSLRDEEQDWGACWFRARAALEGE